MAFYWSFQLYEFYINSSQKDLKIDEILKILDQNFIYLINLLIKNKSKTI